MPVESRTTKGKLITSGKKSLKIKTLHKYEWEALEYSYNKKLQFLVKFKLNKITPLAQRCFLVISKKNTSYIIIIAAQDKLFDKKGQYYLVKTNFCNAFGAVFVF